MTATLRIAERSGNLIRLDGLAGWLAAHDLKPCGRCGGTRFLYQAKGSGWFCVVCPPRRGVWLNPAAPQIDVLELRRQLDEEFRDGNGR